MEALIRYCTGCGVSFNARASQGAKRYCSVACQLWSRVARGEPNECWPYLGPKNADGYGRNKFGDRTRGAHQLAYELVKGPIPSGMVVCHQCDNPPCCNPSHLWLGTNAENVRDRDRKNRRVAPKGQSHPSSKLSDMDVLRIATSEESNIALGKKFGVHHSLCSLVKRGKRQGILKVIRKQAPDDLVLPDLEQNGITLISDDGSPSLVLLPWERWDELLSQTHWRSCATARSR